MIVQKIICDTCGENKECWRIVVYDDPIKLQTDDSFHRIFTDGIQYTNYQTTFHVCQQCKINVINSLKGKQEKK